MRVDALARGMTPATVHRALNNLTPNPSVIERDRTQTELVLTVEQYVQRRLTRAYWMP